jgi:hypothetical protein
MAPLMTQAAVENALVGLGHYRVQRVQTVALEGLPDGISGPLLLGMGLRESGLKNVTGGLAYVNPDSRRERWPVDRAGGVWVAEWDPKLQDVSWVQISRRWNGFALSGMPGVESGTWGPVVAGSAADEGLVPQFERSLRFTLDLLHEHMAQAGDAGATMQADQVAIAVAAHNCGIYNAVRAWKGGDVDRYTTQGDYSAWVFHHRTMVNRALNSERFKNWRVT